MTYEVETTADLVFAAIDGTSLMLNLHRPVVDDPVPVVLYLHGGGWRRGDRTSDVDARLRPVAAAGLAVASIDYRLAPESTYPAQIHDVKAATRWLRAHAKEHGLISDRVGVWGASAGALLGTLAALTPDDPELEGKLGHHLEQSSRLDAVVHWFGPTDFVTTSTRTPMEANLLPPPFEGVLLGGDSQEQTAATAEAASPYARIHSTAPPFLIVHGDRDRIAPISEAHAFFAALSRAGVEASFLSVAGAGHEDPRFQQATLIELTAAFLLAELLSPECVLKVE